MDNDLTDMYDTTFIENQTNQQSPPNKPQKAGMLLEIEINGTKVYTVDPVEFNNLQNTIQNLKYRLNINEQLVRQLQSTVRQRDQYIQRIKQELDTKVSHET